MIITDFSFKREHWSLSQIHLHNINLFVGPNAVGKSKTVNAILRVADAISGRQDFRLQSTFSTNMTLQDGLTRFLYSFSVVNGVVSYENLQSSDGSVLIERNDSKVLFYGKEVNPPSTRLLLGSRRDTEKYPQVEALMHFFENVSLFSFSSISPGEKVLDPITIGGFNVAGMFSKLSTADKSSIVNLLNVLGFKVSSIHPILGDTLLAMKEEGVGSEFVMWAFSTGLIRIVSLLTFLYHFSVNSRGGLILIDDLGEGLDYHRSTKLGKFICDYCEEKGIQVVLTTNDSFLMNVIDVDNWNILSRKGSTVSAMSRDTNPSIFTDFKLTGLSNYDLFKSDFIERRKGN